MMYKLIEIIDRVNDFKLIENTLCLWQSDKIIYHDSIIYNGDIFGCDNYRQSFVIPINSGMSSIYINLDKKIKKEFSYIKGVKAFINEEEILYNTYVKENRIRYITRINLLTEEKKWEIESYFGRGKILDNYLYATGKRDTIYKIDLDHPENPLWQFDLSQLGTLVDNYSKETKPYKVEKILGIHNEHLYVALNGSLLLELDIATGKITHKWHHLPEKYKEYPDDDFSARLFDLDQANNALVCLSGRRYDSIDLQTKEYNSVYIGEELKKYDIVSIRHQGDFTNEHISAVTHLKNDTWFQDGIVMFNRKRNKIDFFYKDETFTTGTATPKLAGNKLYQLDLDGNLYIFEKEEDV